MFGKRVQQRARQIAELVVRPLAKLRVTPNMLTFIGLLLNMATAAIIGLGYLQIGGLMVLFSGLFDLLDGAMARVTSKKSTFGAFLDSTLDRYSEGIVLLGFVIYSIRQQQFVPNTQNFWIMLLAYLCMLGSLMISYTRARAEGLGLECKIGLLARPERVLLLTLGLLLQLLLPMLAIMALLVNFTAVQRIIHVWRIAHGMQEGSLPTADQRSLALSDGVDHAAHDRPALLERWRPVRR